MSHDDQLVVRKSWQMWICEKCGIKFGVEPTERCPNYCPRGCGKFDAQGKFNFEKEKSK